MNDHLAVKTALYILCLGLSGVMEALLYICERKEMASVTSESFHDVNNNSLATTQTESFTSFNAWSVIEVKIC